jgi:hypothetical protein
MTDEYAPLPPTELWLCHLACVSWSEPERWVRYFGEVQEVLGADVTHLDKDDSVQRRVKPGKLTEAADYVTAISKREDSRWVLGRVEALGFEFSIRHYRESRGWPNSITWHFAPDVLENAIHNDTICRLFDVGNLVLSPFYAYAETKDRVSAKKKESGAVDIQAELLGVFWLTYFDHHYVNFLGREKVLGLQGVHVSLDGGATLRLGETPSAVPDRLRDDVEAKLGHKTFVKPQDFSGKRPGQYALTFDQLRT